MRRILELCVALDRTALETYRGMASACELPELAEVFGGLAREERRHIDWWTDLLAAWESGLVPDIADEHDLVNELIEVQRCVEEALPERFSGLGSDQMLDIAARLEFYMLDPVFGELADLMGPGSSTDRHEAYSRHVMRVVEAIERFHSAEGPAKFLARMLRRAYRDQQRFAALSVEDHLTGLYNRRGLLGHLNQWLAWSSRYDRPVAVVLVDVDELKTTNDMHGHQAGDEVLRSVAAALKDGVRTSDILGRFGGDEFLVLAPETGEEDLVQLMERLVEQVRIASPVPGKPGIRTRVSAGGAWVSGGPPVSSEAILAEADRSLYEAKTAGRDRAGSPRSVSALV